MGSSKFSQILGSQIVQSERPNGMDGQMKMDGCAKVLLKWGAPGGVHLVVISYEFRMGQYRNGDHREDAPHFR